MKYCTSNILICIWVLTFRAHLLEHALCIQLIFFTTPELRKIFRWNFDPLDKFELGQDFPKSVLVWQLCTPLHVKQSINSSLLHCTRSTSGIFTAYYVWNPIFHQGWTSLARMIYWEKRAYTRRFKTLVKDQHLKFKYLAIEKLDIKAPGHQSVCVNNCRSTKLK